MPAFKGSKVLGTLSGGVHPKGTAPVAGMTGTQGARTTDPKMVNKPTLSNPDETYTRATKSKKTTKKMAKGGSIDGCAIRGKTKGKFV